MRGIIFDLDGVICHTDTYHFLAWRAVAEGLNIPFDEKLNERLRGVSRAESLEIILKNGGVSLSDSEKAAWIEEKNIIYRKFLQNITPTSLDNEVKETLLRLRDKGLKLAIGSSSRNAKFILQRLGLADFFDAISDGTNITKSKPDPEVFLKAADMLGENPQACLVVEDAEAGLQAAHAGGMKAAGIGTAAGNPLADYKLDNFGDLLAIAEQ
ncbi:MAG: beta-phosphoglucomutase [Selenomonas sp.]|uniref:beta-phosphoglucomutase n=1 Tax=Selenomonas sp. TaxID=2053611 RepID=UPI0025FF0A24|nr:beta-phosphoglucomutase [Selenomonas sp.]MCR5757173.1 beta-phosphoglucomutase [Selenomonas sp.]